MHLRSALDLHIASSRKEVLTLQDYCVVTCTPSSSDDVLRVVDLDFSLPPDATEEQVAQYAAHKATLEASIVAYRLTPDAMPVDGRFTLDDPCNLLRIDSKLHNSWKRNAWALVPTQLDAVLSLLTKANQRWQEAVAADRFAGRDLDFVVLEEDEFSEPDGFLARTIAHLHAQHHTAQNGRLYCVADGVPFTAVHLPKRDIPDLVNPFIVVLSAATRFRRMLDRRAGLVPEHLIELWAKLQTVMDAIFFKPVGWDDPTAYLASAFQRMSEHGKSRRKPYRDAYMENLLRRKKQMPPWMVLRRSTEHQQRQRREQQEPHSDGLWAVFLDRRTPARDRNLALFAVLGRHGSS